MTTFTASHGDARLPPNFWSKVEIAETGCWTWTGARSVGYGHFAIKRRTNLAHRVAYEALVGPIGDGLTIDHLCRNPACVNPAHLEPVTMGENMRRSTAIDATKARHARRTHCKHGHEFTSENTSYDSKGARVCRECDRMKSRRYQRRRHGWGQGR
jgi:hypothetical protein